MGAPWAYGLIGFNACLLSSLVLIVAAGVPHT